MTRQVFKERLRDLKTENDLIESIDEKMEIENFFYNYWPTIKKAKKYPDPEMMLREYSLGAIIELGYLMVKGKTEKIKLDSAKEILHMSLGRPSIKTANLRASLSNLDENELDALLRSYLSKLNPEQQKLLSGVIEVQKESKNI